MNRQTRRFLEDRAHPLMDKISALEAAQA